MPLSEKQEGFANRLDELGLGLIAAPVVGDIASRTLAHRGGTLGAIGQAGQHFHEHYGPYSDLAGLALIAPTVMHGITKKVVPDELPPEEAAPALPKLAYALGRRAALAKFALDEQLSEGGYTEDEAQQLFRETNPDELEQEHRGLNEELEHRDITQGDDALTKKIVEAHLEEDPHYYTKLKRALQSKG